MKTKSRTFIAFLLVSIAIAVFGWQWFTGEDKRLLQPGPLSYAHHQIELACDSCHDSRFAGNAGIEQQCRNCHAEELKAMDDAHGQKKFADPRNAAELAILDATKCLNCHQEHQPEFTRKMSVTQPADYCVACHQEIFTERESHKNLGADTCTNSGCHNYHDASTLYENFLVAHLNESNTAPNPKRLARIIEKKPALIADRLSPSSESGSETIQNAHQQWQQSAHALGHANCSDCHHDNNWQVSIEPCERCHEAIVEGFQQGHHGMRMAVGLSPLTVSDSKLPMHQDASEKTMNCHSCHQPHRYDTYVAEAEACLGCHNDNHSQQWQSSKHAALWRKNPDTGASCATCHMPRIANSATSKVHVEHNHSANLRPNDKMLKTVCMNCHGVEFSLVALADPAQIESNFGLGVTASHPSMNFVRDRQAAMKK